MNMVTTVFTFHYVSILINKFFRLLINNFIVYIPLCLYFNAESKRFARASPEVYIPLGLYFNWLQQKKSLTLYRVYIPLCLYFNSDNKSETERMAALHSIMSLF